MEFVKHLNTEVEKLLAEKPKVAQLEDILKKLLVFLHPNHYLLYNVKHTLVQLYGNNGEGEVTAEFLKEKLKMCQELVQITRKLDPGCARYVRYLEVHPFIIHIIFILI